LCVHPVAATLNTTASAGAKSINNGRVETIDVFRGLAILIVVLFHFTARLPPQALNIETGAPPPVFFGWVGVYFFFIVSGYCILMTLERSPTVGVFLARRFSRIYPAFAAAVLLLFAFGMVFHIPSIPEAKFHVTPLGLLDVTMDLVFVGEIGEWVNGSFWSIAVEIKFYILIALLAAVFKDSLRFTRVFSLLALVMAPVWMLSTVVSSDDAITPQSMLKFLAIAPFLSFFAIGLLGRQVQSGAMRLGGLFAASLALSILVVWIEAGPLGEPNGMFYADVCALVYLALAGLFLAFILGWSVPKVPFVSAALAQVGLLSFSWYLIHETMGVSFLSTLNMHLPAWLSLVIVVASTFLAAVVFANLFEWRFRKQFERAAMTLLQSMGQIRGLGALQTRPIATPAE
jgi:peptidoglycan/LPS O-acetylase OafA/YrhL